MQHIIKELLFPRRCPVCDDLVVPFGALCCEKCEGHFRYLGDNYCMKCGKGLSGSEKEYCGDCRRRQHRFVRGRSLYHYESAAGAIFRFKYQGRQEYADFFGRELYRRLGSDIMNMKAEAVIPVPLHRSRYIERGYNQAALLGKVLAEHCQIPFMDYLVVRRRKTVPQKKLNYTERQKNLKKAFKMRVNGVKLKSVIIVDDIYTTGSTVDALAETLSEAGMEDIYVITLAAGIE